MKFKVLIFTFFISHILNSQSKLDSLFVKNFIEERMSHLDLKFPKSYFLRIQSGIHYKQFNSFDSTYPFYLLGQNINWSDFGLKSKRLKYIDKSTIPDTCVYILAPIINVERNKLCITFIIDQNGLSHFYKYYFIKKRKKWRFDFERDGYSF